MGASSDDDRATRVGIPSAEDVRPAFAVIHGGVKRKVQNAGNPLSPHWTLYDPAPLAVKLGLPLEDVERALAETGFAKAVSVRMELVRWKERLRKEEKELTRVEGVLTRELVKVRERLRITRHALGGARNVLRLPRDPFAQGMSAGTAETAKQARGEARQPGSQSECAQTPPSDNRSVKP